MKTARVLAFIALLVAAARPSWAFHVPPFDTSHEQFDASDGDENLDAGATTPCGQGSPVSVATGDFTQSIPVLSIPSRGPGVNLLLTYHTFTRKNGLFGIGWTSEYEQRIIKTTDGVTITAICANATGKRDRYTRRADGTYSSPAPLHNTLTENADGSFVLRQRTGLISTFSKAGRLVSIADRWGNALSLTYDAAGFLTALTDAPGRVVSLTKGANGRVAMVTDPANRQFAFSYDATGRMTALTSPLGNSVSIQYGSNGYLTTLSDPKGNVLVTATYNADGTVATYRERGETWTVAYSPSSGTTSETDSSGNRWLHLYNTSGAILLTVDPLGNSIGRVFDANMNVRQFRDENLHVTTMIYDANGNPTDIQDGFGKSVKIAYQCCDPTFIDPASVTDRMGNVTTFATNSRGSLLSATNALGQSVQYQYDAVGQMIAAIDAAGKTTAVAYDWYGNVTSVTDPLNHVRSFTYDVIGNLTSLSDPNGRKMQFTYDGEGHTTKAIDAGGAATSYAYDKSGNLTSVTTPDGRITSYAYDALNRPVQSTNPLGSSSTYTYDRKDNVLSKTDANGVTTSFVYDKLGRLTSKSSLSGTVTYSYDKAGLPLTVNNANANISFAYDANNRVTQITTTSPYHPTTTISYSYDADDRRLTMTDPSAGTTTYTYDALSRLASVRDPFANLYTFSYDALSRRTAFAGPSGRTVSYGWDAASRLTSQTDQSPVGTLNFAYTYDAAGNALTKTDSTGLHTYQYDALSRLTAATHPAGPAESYTYDAMGNRTASSLSGSYLYNPANRLSSDATFVYAHDSNGNLTRKTTIFTMVATSYSYDADNRLTTVTPPVGSAVTYRYDGLGRRVAKIVNGSVTGYVYDGQDLLTEYFAVTLAANYVHGPGIDETLSVRRAGTTYFSQKDAIGSVVRTYSAAAIANTFQYDSFGRITAQTGTAPAPYAFTGREFDSESGLYYYRSRYYEATLGRFTSEDPIGLLGGVNRYAYVGNNPVNATDPTGLNPFIGAIVGGAIGGLGNLGYQLYHNGGKLGCVSLTSAAGWAVRGALVGAGVGLAAEWAAAAGEGTVSVFHGSIRNGAEILERGLDPTRGTTFVSSEFAAARDALLNHPDAVPGLGRIIESRIPTSLFNDAFAPFTRPYRGFFPYELQSTEIPLRWAEQIELFNRYMVVP